MRKMLASLAVVAIFSAACTSDDRADPATGQLFETPEPVAANSQPAPDQGVTDDSVEEPVIEDDSCLLYTSPSPRDRG